MDGKNAANAAPARGFLEEALACSYAHASSTVNQNLNSVQYQYTAHSSFVAFTIMQQYGTGKVLAT